MAGKLNIVDVFLPHMALKQSGQTWLGLCPFHNQRLPSFYVSESRQIYHCLSCGVTGHAGDAARYFELLKLHQTINPAI